MSDEAFDEIYKVLRGSRLAFKALDAKTAFFESNFEESERLLGELLQAYSESRRATLEKSPSEKTSDSKSLDKDSRRDLRRTEKAHGLVEKVKSLLNVIQRKTRSVTNKPQDPIVSKQVVAPTKNDSEIVPTQPAQLKQSKDRRASLDELRKSLSDFYDIRPMLSDTNLSVGMQLILSTNDEMTPVEVISLEGNCVAFKNITDGKRWKPIDLVKLASAIAKKNVFVLHPIESDSDHVDEEDRKTDLTAEGIAPVLQPSADDESFDPASILDMGSFSQLIDAAQRSQLVSNITSLIEVRDCDFRLGHYHKAIQTMEGLLAQFISAEAQRNSRLMREDTAIKSGAIKLSPREMQAKKMRDQQETQAVDRAKNRFQRVVEGLRAIIHHMNKRPKE